MEINIATIGAVFDDGVTLIFDGQEEATEKHYKCNTSINFAAGDRVIITEFSGTYIVTFKVGNPGEDVEGLPAGGTTGQVLKKITNTDYDTRWSDEKQELPTGGTTGQVLKKKSDNSGDVKWGDETSDLPTGGTTGQALKKRSGKDRDVYWGDDDSGLPLGGISGQVLVKNSTVAGDASWKTSLVDLSQSNKLKFFTGYGGAAQQTVNKIYSPASATAKQVAQAYNTLIDALKAYNLIK